MSKRHFLHFPLIVCLGLGLIPIASAADEDLGQQTAQLCSACHLPDGAGKDNANAESWPRLAGLDADYLYQQLLSFKDGSRFAPSMMPFVNMLDDKQMRAVTKYYANLPVPEIQGTEGDEKQLALGEKLATRGDWQRYIPPCQSCHGPNNLGVGSTFPAIAGQHASYIETQIHRWQEDQRKNDPDQLMVSIAKRMTPEDIQAVAAWLSQQPGVKTTGEGQ